MRQGTVVGITMNILGLFAFQGTQQGTPASWLASSGRFSPPGGRFYVRYFWGLPVTRLNRIKEVWTWVLTYEATPIVLPLKAVLPTKF